MQDNQDMQPIKADKAFFIKLGGGGEWEKQCIEENTLRLGYHDQKHELCIQSQWEDLANAMECKDSGSRTRHINQIKKFYDEPSTTLWITFYSNYLYWCFAKPEVIQLDDKSKIRYVTDKWRNTDIKGKLLTKNTLSGKLLTTQGFQGTICSIKVIEYLLNKINGTLETHIGQAYDAIDSLVNAVIPIIQNLHPTDLEILTDLIFRQGGWQRVGVIGKTEKDIDLDLISSITRQQIAIQVKSESSLATYQKYREIFEKVNNDNYKFYFVTHSPDKALEEYISARKNNQDNDDKIIFWSVNDLAQQAVNNGLVRWLLDKAA